MIFVSPVDDAIRGRTEEHGTASSSRSLGASGTRIVQAASIVAVRP
jgi:hypothetical protein